MSDQYIMGYKIHFNITHFTPDTVLFSSETDCITVSMVNNVLDYILNIIALKNPLLESYKRAKMVFTAIRNGLANKQMPRLSKKDLETTVDVLKEILNANAKTEQQKEQNERNALICKLLINSFGGDMP